MTLLDLDDPKWTAYALGELSDTERAELERTLEDSPEARAHVDSLRETFAAIEGELKDQPPLALDDLQRRRIHKAAAKPKRSHRRWMIGAAGLAAAGTVALTFTVHGGDDAKEKVAAQPAATEWSGPRGGDGYGADKDRLENGDVGGDLTVDGRQQAIDHARHAGILGEYKQKNNGLRVAAGSGQMHFHLPTGNTHDGEDGKGFNTEAYRKIDENPFKLTQVDPLSTFSADVDTASYANIRRFLSQQLMPPPDAVRIEEMINYFRYSYPEPEAGEPFSITTEVAPSPWNAKHQLVRVGIKAPDIAAAKVPPRNLVFLIDTSGSMSDANKLPLLVQSLNLLVETLRPEDKVSIVVYAGSAGLVLPPTSGTQKADIRNALSQLAAGGATNGGAGIQLAYDTARKSFLPAGINRVVLCSDGDYNVGTTSDVDLTRLIEKEREHGVFLTVLGFGMGTHLLRVAAAAGGMTEKLTPRVLAVFTFLVGVVLLLSGATPAEPGRLRALEAVLPLGVIEASHFLGSVLGVTLLILSQGLARRLDAAYYLTAGAMLVGMAASLLKGFDYEEAGLLLLVLAVLWRARPAFDRRAAFFETRFSAPWIAAVVGAIGASVWLGLFAFQHVYYSHQLWWQFELQSDASRFLRASVGAAIVAVVFGVFRLVRQAPHEAPPPTDADLADAARIIATQPSTYPFLAYLRDKSLLFNDARTAFVMYAVRGRTWVALGDPVGPDDQAAGLIRRFVERCDDFGGVPVFYEIGKARLHMYADVGLGFVKLGEEARVDLSRFTLAGGQAAKRRQGIRRLEKDGASFRVVEAADVPALIPRLREVSDNWLAAKAAAEKGFSLGFFDEAYVSRFPVAVIERDGRILAFANIWAGANHEEMSVDLMRYHRDAPPSVMEALFVHLMQWGHEHGYRWFMLGMAPLSGVERSPVASLWNRLGAFLYEHGEPIYHFQGLRAYKEKFGPAWEPHYLAYPGGLRLPLIVADVSALVAGGYRRIFGK